MNSEQRRLDEDRDEMRSWRQFGPYLSERQWGTVRLSRPGYECERILRKPKQKRCRNSSNRWKNILKLRVSDTFLKSATLRHHTRRAGARFRPGPMVNTCASNTACSLLQIEEHTMFEALRWLTPRKHPNV